MRCTYPRTVGFRADGKTLAWSSKDHSKEYETFQLPCGNCLECRLEYSRQWAIRCVHEAQMHENNSFITLTYSDENLVSPKLIYKDFQLFMKRLRKTQSQPIGCFVTGEYGDENKRPHWHAILFGYYPSDAIPLRKNGRGDQIFASKTLDRIWGKNDPNCKPNEIGEVNFLTAGYVARYAAKKLGHSDEFNENFKPISRKSNKNAIGKRWLEKFSDDIFNEGLCILIDGTKHSVPRYYEKWLQKNKPERWEEYVTETKQKRINKARSKALLLSDKEIVRNDERRRATGLNFVPVITENQVRRKIQEQKNNQFKQIRREKC